MDSKNKKLEMAVLLFDCIQTQTNSLGNFGEKVEILKGILTGIMCDWCLYQQSSEMYTQNTVLSTFNELKLTACVGLHAVKRRNCSTTLVFELGFL